MSSLRLGESIHPRLPVRSPQRCAKALTVAFPCRNTGTTLSPARARSIAFSAPLRKWASRRNGSKASCCARRSIQRRAGDERPSVGIYSRAQCRKSGRQGPYLQPRLYQTWKIRGGQQQPGAHHAATDTLPGRGPAKHPLGARSRLVAPRRGERLPQKV